MVTHCLPVSNHRAGPKEPRQPHRFQQIVFRRMRIHVLEMQATAKERARSTQNKPTQIPESSTVFRRTMSPWYWMLTPVNSSGRQHRSLRTKQS